MPKILNYKAVMEPLSNVDVFNDEINKLITSDYKPWGGIQAVAGDVGPILVQAMVLYEAEKIPNMG